MKNIYNYVFLFVLIFFLSSCFGSKDDDKISQAKKDLWIIESEIVEDNDSWWNIWQIDINDLSNSWSKNKEELKEKKEKIKITSITEKQFLELDDLSDENIFDWEVEITWKTLTNVDKIVVIYENTESDFPKDTYTLQQFSSWDKTFLYRAFSMYETLDFGKNIYTIEAYSWEEISKLELIINVIKEDEINESEKIKDFNYEIWLDSLPIWSWFWNPIDLWNWKIWYSDLSWLEIYSYKFDDISCEKLTDSLTKKINSWFYWNTCRPILDDKWISYFVIRIEWEKYYYEKHYYLIEKSLYWIQELESWEWIDDINISEKNQELKLNNEDYNILYIIDDLFKKIAIK